jgi:exodeoxyribonuclease V alpha subunit
MFPGGERFPDYDPDKFCIDEDFLIVDECSMIDILLMLKLVEECSPHTRIIFVGDVDQLGPINAGHPFADLITSESFPVTRLNQIFRYTEGGAIAEAAQAINSGDGSCIMNGSLNGSEFEFIECKEADQIATRICGIAAHELRNDPSPSHVQILTPVHKGICGRLALNVSVRAALGRPEKRAVPGDRLMQMSNDTLRMLLNGETGIVTSASDAGITVDFDGEARCRFETDCRAAKPGEAASCREVACRGSAQTYGKADLAKCRSQGPTNNLDWAYAVTVHKAQGMEFDIVIVPAASSFSFMLLRNLFYTAVSRGKKKVIVIGAPEALMKAARNLRGTYRITKLAEFLNPSLDWTARAPNMGAINNLELERATPAAEDDEEAAYVALIEKEERLLAKFEAGEATDEEIEWLISMGRWVVEKE